MKILLALQSPDYMRFYDETVVALGQRGHSIELAVSKESRAKSVQLADYERDGVIAELGRLPKRKDIWSTWVRGVRGTSDFVRYLHPDYRDAPVLRARMRGKVLPGWLGFLDASPSWPVSLVAAMQRLLAYLERCAPVCPATRRWLAKRKPDLVVVSPQIDAASPLIDVVRASQEAGIPVATCIASWDNLTNKGLLRVVPDRVIVWNEVQRREAERMHGVPHARVSVTGAQVFDRWFGRRPSRTREQLCAEVGLPTGAPLVVFMGSSSFISKWGDDVEMIRDWARGLRESRHDALRSAAILVRPHPYYFAHWTNADLSDVGAVVWPRSYGAITDEDNRRNFFDTLYHCDAVVGINTSAMIEAAILGKPVHSIRVDELAGTQDGTLHFRYLLPENGGFLWVADSLADHADKLARTLRGEYDVERTRSFVASFLRPHGIDRDCVPVLADAIEEAQVAGPQPHVRRGPLARLGGFVVAPAAVLSKALEARRKGKPVLASLRAAR